MTKLEKLETILDMIDIGEEPELGDFVDSGLGGYPYSAVKHGSLPSAISAVWKNLPGWWFRIGSCHLSDDACIGPDYNDPKHRERLLAEFDGADDWVEITDVDLRPAGNLAKALVMSIIKAKIHIEKAKQ